MPPPGFSVHLEFNSSVQLKPIQVYINVIELVSRLSNLPWTVTLPGSIRMTSTDASTVLTLSPYPPFGDSSLRVQYAILGLYQAGVAIALENQFYQLNASLYMNDRKVGWFEFLPSGSPLHESSNLDHRLPLSFDYANDTNARAESGKITDPEDRNSVITYEWDGVRIKSQDIFTALLNGFAIAAEHNNPDLNAYVPAARSTSGDIILSTWTVGGVEDPYMTWARLKKAFIMLWQALIIGRQGQKPRFEGFSFGLEYDEKEIGAGRMLRFDMDGEGALGSGVEK